MAAAEKGIAEDLPGRVQLDRIEAKVNALAKALGGPILRREFGKIERDVPKSRKTF